MNSGIRSLITALIIAGVLSPTVLGNESDSREKKIYEEACTSCHSLYPIEATRDGRAGWEDTVHKMVVAGAQLNAEEMKLVIDYLASNFGPANKPMETGILPPRSPLYTGENLTAKDVGLPNGEGKELINTYCTVCHDLGRVVSTRRGNWERYVKNMLAQGGMDIPEKELSKIVEYLSEHFSDG